MVRSSGRSHPGSRWKTQLDSFFAHELEGRDDRFPLHHRVRVLEGFIAAKTAVRRRNSTLPVGDGHRELILDADHLRVGPVHVVGRQLAGHVRGPGSAVPHLLCAAEERRGQELEDQRLATRYHAGRLGLRTSEVPSMLDTVVPDAMFVPLTTIPGWIEWWGVGTVRLTLVVVVAAEVVPPDASSP